MKQEDKELFFDLLKISFQIRSVSAAGSKITGTAAMRDAIVAAKEAMEVLKKENLLPSHIETQ